MSHDETIFIRLLAAGNIFAEVVDELRASEHRDAVRQQLKSGINKTLDALENHCKVMYKVVYSNPVLADYYNSVADHQRKIAELFVDIPAENWPLVIHALEKIKESAEVNDAEINEYVAKIAEIKKAAINDYTSTNTGYDQVKFSEQPKDHALSETTNQNPDQPQ